MNHNIRELLHVSPLQLIQIQGYYCYWKFLKVKPACLVCSILTLNMYLYALAPVWHFAWINSTIPLTVSYLKPERHKVIEMGQ